MPLKHPWHTLRTPLGTPWTLTWNILKTLILQLFDHSLSHSLSQSQLVSIEGTSPLKKRKEKRMLFLVALRHCQQSTAWTTTPERRPLERLCQYWLRPQVLFLARATEGTLLLLVNCISTSRLPLAINRRKNYGSYYRSARLRVWTISKYF